MAVTMTIAEIGENGQKEGMNVVASIMRRT